MTFIYQNERLVSAAAHRRANRIADGAGDQNVPLPPFRRNAMNGTMAKPQASDPRTEGRTEGRTMHANGT